MRLDMPGELAAGYKSPSQRTRVVSEAWGEQNLYCPSCVSPRLVRSPAGTEVVDYTCPQCESAFQLKSQSRPYASRISDAAYNKMRDAIVHGQTPNLFALHYDSNLWVARNLILVPRFVFSLSCLERRNPLRPTARRHGHVLCNILLASIPRDARINVVTDGVPARPVAVREQYARLRPLEKLNYDQRGWTLDVLNVVRSLGKQEFLLADVYGHSDELQRLHPRNLHIRDKLRQQLQFLRDLGFVEFLGEGTYRLM